MCVYVCMRACVWIMVHLYDTSVVAVTLGWVQDGSVANPGVEPGVGEALPTASGVGRTVHRELVLPLHGVDEVVGGVPGGRSDL